MVSITGKTSFLALLGKPVSHSLSPIIHNAALQEMGLDWCYLAIPCEETNVEIITKALREMNCKGINITIPYKQKILNVCKEITPLAKEIQAVNTLIPQNQEEWIGTNTDIEGFVAPLKDKKLTNKKAVIIGCGGSARAVLTGLLSLNLKKITTIGRNQSSLNKFLVNFTNKQAPQAITGILHTSTHCVEALKDADLIVNTTPVGMHNISNEIPLGLEIWKNLDSNQILYDLIYTPRPTEWLKLGLKKNCLIIDGLEMLIQQGASSLRLWSGISNIPIKIMRESAIKHLLN